MLRISGSVAAGFARLLLHEQGSGRELSDPKISYLTISSVQSLSRVRLFATP